ncbi:MAG: hypothetical protein ABS96_28850 [Lysobacteraceae bacterium SCN 69-123]|nr:MAG: hypothetical protein ABS96_28850 [Xanthomonadaceae bacterium SCN 69-123]
MIHQEAFCLRPDPLEMRLREAALRVGVFRPRQTTASGVTQEISRLASPQVEPTNLFPLQPQRVPEQHWLGLDQMHACEAVKVISVAQLKLGWGQRAIEREESGRQNPTLDHGVLAHKNARCVAAEETFVGVDREGLNNPAVEANSQHHTIIALKQDMPWPGGSDQALGVLTSGQISHKAGLVQGARILNPQLCARSEKQLAPLRRLN